MLPAQNYPVLIWQNQARVCAFQDWEYDSLDIMVRKIKSAFYSLQNPPSFAGFYPPFHPKKKSYFRITKPYIPSTMKKILFWAGVATAFSITGCAKDEPQPKFCNCTSTYSGMGQTYTQTFSFTADNGDCSSGNTTFTSDLLTQVTICE